MSMQVRSSPDSCGPPENYIIWIAAAFQSVCLIQRFTTAPAFVFNQATYWPASQMELPRRATAMDTYGTIVTLTESFTKTVTGALPSFSTN